MGELIDWRSPQGLAEAFAKLDAYTDTLAARALAGVMGPLVTYASATGSINDVAPAGFSVAPSAPTGRLDVTLAAGIATFTGLLAGADGQLLWLRNADATHALTLSNDDAASAAANRFKGTGNAVLAAFASILLCYSTAASRWIMKA